MRKFKYIGNCSLEGSSRHFVIEVTEENFQNAKTSKCHLRGTVIAAGKNSPWEVGHYSNTWANPFCSMLDYGFPVFILID
jgi:hypothetical protein